MPARRTRARAGGHARATVERLRLRTLLLLGALAVGTAYVGRTFGLRDPIYLTSEITLLLAILIVTHSIIPLVERHERGASGEEEVGALLESLRHLGWQVLHDMGFGHGNVDHLLIGPGGIFTVETKSHPGPISVRAIHGGALEQARAEQRTLERITGEEVEALLVYSRAWVDRPLARRKGVRVVPARMLASYLERRPVILAEAEVERALRRVLAACEEDAAPAARGSARGRPRRLSSRLVRFLRTDLLRAAGIIEGRAALRRPR